ncbi:MAG: 50S ribosomal protein L25/general stress protein Ctc [Acidiferrobacterales bacterium]|nr:50S ribosomal protein L25/general stress protein Ctc [Gammaproteobacteria bacterium]
MSMKFELTAERRDAKGSGPNRRLRRAGQVPAVLYGGDKDPVMLKFNHDAIYHQLENEAFHTSVLTVKVDGDTDRAILRNVQMHPFKPRVIHVDLQRISETQKLHMLVPIHVNGEEEAPGVKLEGGIVSRLMTEVDISCLPHQLPEFLSVDVSELQLGESLHLSNIPLPEGVTITSLAHGGEDLAVVSVAAVRVVEEEVAEEVPEEVAEGEEAATEEAGAPPSEEPQQD